MNIPDEAAKRYPTEWILVSEATELYDVNGGERDAFIAGAEWAQKETLREVASRALQVTPSQRPSGKDEVRGFADAKTQIISGIRALAEE